jgi:hypothetical protein
MHCRRSHPKGSGYAHKIMDAQLPYGLDGCTSGMPSYVFILSRLKGFGTVKLSDGILNAPISCRLQSHTGGPRINFARVNIPMELIRLTSVKRGCFKSEPTLGQANRDDVVCDVCRVLKVMAQRSDRVTPRTARTRNLCNTANSPTASFATKHIVCHIFIPGINGNDSMANIRLQVGEHQKCKPSSAV